MEVKKEERTAPVNPYDESMWDRWNMYDNMPYIWDPDLCDARRLAAESGNIIKSYRCLIKEPFEVKH